MDNTFRWQSLLKALGIKGDAKPALNFDWQPTIQVADASELAPLFRAPRGLYGNLIAAGGAGTFAGIEVQPMTDGGCFVELLHWSAGIFNVAWEIQVGASILGAMTAVTPEPMTADPVKAIVTAGTHAVLADTTKPLLTGENISDLFAFGMEIPHGSVLSLKSRGTNLAVTWLMTVRDVPETLGAP